MKKYDFLPNRQNKYSIRKFTVGTASILLGSLLLIGKHHEAEAAETTSNTSTNTSTTPEPTADTGTTSTTTDSAPATTATPTNTSTETSSDNTATASAPSSTLSSDKTTTAAAPSSASSSDKTTTASAPSSTSSSDKTATASAPSSASSSDNTATAPAPSSTSSSDKTATAPAPSSTSSSDSTTTTPVPSSTSSSIQTVAPAPTSSSTETTTQPTNTVTATDTTAPLSVAPTNTSNTNNAPISDLFNTPSNNQNATTAETTPTLRTLSLAAQPRMVSRAASTGNNVNNLVTVTNPAISKTAIDPNQSGNFRLTANYQVDGKVKGGDYFTVQMPTYANLNGELDFSASNNQFPINLYSPASYVVANGVYDTTTKTLTYTFTDWVNDKDNISGRFDLAQFADRKTAQHNGTYALNYNLAGETYNTSITYNYDRHDYGVYPSSVDTMITGVDGTETTNQYKQVIYVNPKDVNLSSARLILDKDTANSNAIIDLNTTKLHIYQVPNPNDLTDSYNFDPTKYTDWAPNFYNNNSIYTNKNGKLEINFGAIDTPFVVVVESKFDPNHSNDLSTRATFIATDYLTNTTSAFNFDNGFLITTSSGSGDGTTKTYSLGDYVWEDTNQNGIQDANEDPLEGVVVTLRDSSGYVVKTAVTDKYGNYLFSGLKNGSYTIDFVTPDGYLPTASNEGSDTTKDSNGTEVSVTINDADDFTIDSGFYKPTPEPTPVPAKYDLGDYVWNDSNNDDIQNSNEVGIAGVTVTLTKPDGTTETTTTDASGKYVFKGLENGDYTVTFTTPAGYEPTLKNVGDYRLDSNGLSTTAIINNADNFSVDSGFYQPPVEPTPVPATYELGDYVWNDSNKDGIQNSNESGIAGVTVTLTKPDGSTETTTTDTSGKYVFKDLENGEYTVTFTTPEGYVPTLINVGDAQLDSNGLSTTAIINNANNHTIDSGFHQATTEPTPSTAKYNLGDYVWNDSNRDGIQNSNEHGIAGVTVTLTKPDGSTETTTTDASGKYLFTGLENGDYTVTFTAPQGLEPTLAHVGDDRLDSNGLSTTATINNADNMSVDSGFYQPVVEPTPVPATYELGDYVWNDTNRDGIQNSNETGIAGVTVTLTKPDGSTETTTTDSSGKYVFKGLENGEYIVTFTTPEGYVPTTINVGDERLDSNGLSTTAFIENADNHTIDSGFHQPVIEPTPVPATYELGDYVWNDSNKDGIQNSNEHGIAGVTVTLTKPDGTTETTTTDASGKYVFKGLENGEYIVTFSTPQGFEHTLTNVGDNRLDSNGLSTTATINNADNMSIDSGFYQPTVEPTPVPATYELGDYVWNDSNKDGIQNSNEHGIAGVTVTLTKPDGTTETTTTDASGKYVFKGLENGDYTVTFTTPDGFEPTAVHVGDDRLDSNGLTTKVTINNADNMSIDSGFYQPTVEPTPQPTPDPDSKPTPDPDPKPTPEPNPNPTPEPSPEPTPEPNPNPTPEPSPEPTPEPNPNPTPEPSPEPMPQSNSGMKSQVKHVSPQIQEKESKAKQTSQKEALPETGHETINNGLLGSLLAGLGALFLFRRKKHTNHKNN